MVEAVCCGSVTEGEKTRSVELGGSESKDPIQKLLEEIVRKIAKDFLDII